MYKFIVSLLIIQTNLFAQDNTEQTLLLRDVTEKVEQCEVQKEALSIQLATVPSIEVLELSCVRDVTKYHIRMLYRDATQTPFLQTASAYPESAATYSSLSTCEKELPEFKRKHGEMTKTQVLFAFCATEYIDSDELYRFSQRVLTYGQPKLNYYVEARQIQNPTKDSAEAVQNALGRAFSQGALKEKIAKVFVAKSNSKLRVVVSYYARRPLALGFDSFGIYEDVKDCEAGKEKVASLMKQVGAFVEMQVCSESVYSSAAKLHSFIYAPRAFAVLRPDIFFSSRELCENSLPGVINQQRKLREGKTVFDGHCSARYESYSAKPVGFQTVIFGEP